MCSFLPWNVGNIRTMQIFSKPGLLYFSIWKWSLVLTVIWQWESFFQVTCDHQFLNSNDHKRLTPKEEVLLENVTPRQPHIARSGAQDGLLFPSNHRGGEEAVPAAKVMEIIKVNDLVIDIRSKHLNIKHFSPSNLDTRITCFKCK